MMTLQRRSSYQFGTIQRESRKCGPDVWVYRYLKTENGKRSRPKVVLGDVENLPSRREAQIACERYRMEINAEKAWQPEYSMRGLIGRYVNEVLQPSYNIPVGGEQEEAAFMSYHCAKTYYYILRRYISTRWDTYKMSDFTNPAIRASIERWLRELMRSTSNPSGLAPKSVRQIYTVMRLTFKFGVKWGYLEYNPMSDKRVELPRGSTKRMKKAPQITPAQFFYLMTLFEPMEKLAISFAGWLGPRISEAFGLRWFDIDFERSLVHFQRGFVQGRITPLKTEASRAVLPIPSEVIQLLREWRNNTPYNNESDWIFASPYTHGKRPYWPVQMLKARIQPIAVKAGFPKITWHSFRHTVSAWGKEAGLELEEVKALLRHENISTTSQIYGELEVEAKRRIQNRLVSFVTHEAQMEDANGAQKQLEDTRFSATA